MNTQSAPSTLDPRLSAPDSQPPTQDSGPETQDSPQAPRHRKIAKPPKPLRDQINALLDDALPAREIIARLQASADPPLPYPISEVNISDWRKTGYQDYLHHQDWRADLQYIRESGSELTELNDGHQ